MDTERAKIEQGSLEYNRLVEKLKPIYYSVETEAYRSEERRVGKECVGAC